MSLSRDAFREKVKKIYKEEVKKVPKNRRVPFAVFFKNYKEYVKAQKELEDTKTEDFNFENLVKVNDNTDKE